MATGDKAAEKVFQQAIVDDLTRQDWLEGKSADYHRELALYPEDLIGYVRQTQPEALERLGKFYGDKVEEKLLTRAAEQMDKHGALHVLRHGFKDRGVKIRLCQFKPDHGLNPETLSRYEHNRLRVVQEASYSPFAREGYNPRLDLVLFVNGVNDRRVFDSVIVITDRTVLDAQLQETIYQFEHAEGVVRRISREDGEGSKSQQLAEALAGNTRIIIVTIQTFPHVLEAIQQQTNLQERRFAVIADEAHSSQTGATARKLRQVLMAEQLPEDAEISAEDVLDATLAARSQASNISYLTFTATPKAKTLQLFGRPPDPTREPGPDNLPQPFHVYTMRQAIEEGFILDVLRRYTTYSMAFRLEQQEAARDEAVDKRKAATRLYQWVKLHPYNIGQKVQVIVEHFRRHVAHLLDGRAKAMVVTDSRKAAVRYKLAFDKYVAEKGYAGVHALVAFSGDVEDRESGPEPFNERNMNPGLKGRDLRDAFDTTEYQVMIVANKFQTGFDQPKLCAMYVDKKLSGVDCVQTLSRLNRTYPGKEDPFVLDFVNKPEDILAAFRPYYETAELADVSDPNHVYELQDKLQAERIFRWDEVEALRRRFSIPNRPKTS